MGILDCFNQSVYVESLLILYVYIYQYLFLSHFTKKSGNTGWFGLRSKADSEGVAPHTQTGENIEITPYVFLRIRGFGVTSQIPSI